MSRNRGERSRSSALVWGLGLIALGVAFLAMRQGALPWPSLHYWWPAFVTVMGLAEMVGARSAKKLGSGVTLVLMSGYFFASVYHWKGLNWATSWPLALVAVGCGAVVEAIASRFMPLHDVDVRVHFEREHDDE